MPTQKQVSEIEREAETVCPGGCVRGNQPMSLCQTCNGTGYIVSPQVVTMEEQ